MSVWSGLGHEIRSAPSEARRTFWTGAVMVALILATGAVDLATGIAPGEPLRSSTALVGTVGLALHTVAATLLRTGRARAAVRAPAPPGRRRTGILRRTYLVLPLLSITATSLLAFASGAMVVVGAGSVRFWLAAGIFGVFAYRAGRTGLESARELYGEARSQREARVRAQAELVEARLLALQARMNPHFLFNALNTVAALLRTDPEAAERTVESLSTLLRHTLRRSDRLLSTVGEEVSYLEAYLGVQAERFGDRLTVEWAVEPETLGHAIPPMTLQPLVENALEHGVGSRIGGATLRISVETRGDALVATVADDGPGMPAGAEEGTGLGNLRERLSTLFDEEAWLDVTSDAEGTTVSVHLPGRTTGDPHPVPGPSLDDGVPCVS